MRKTLGENGLTRKYWLMYAAVFFLTFCGVYWTVFASHKTLLVSGDCRVQSYRAMLYYSRWLKTIFGNFFVKHVFEIPTYTFGLGYGADIVTTLHLQAVGDPFTFFSVFVPDKWIQTFYSICLTARFFTAGITFSLYCFYTGKRRTSSVLTGAVMYVFSAFTLGEDSAHPWFTLALVFFPLMLTGCELIFRERKHWLFILSTGLMGLSNFYYFYVVVLLTVLYVLGRLFTGGERSWKERTGTVLLFLRDGVCGSMIAAPIMLPLLLHSMADSRFTEAYFYYPVYPKGYYAALPGAFLTLQDPGKWTYVGTSFMAVLAVITCVYAGKKYRIGRIAVLTVSVMLLFPIFGRIFNALTYVCNRWSFGIVFLVSFLATELWEEFLEPKGKRLLYCTLTVSAYAVLLFFLNREAEDWIKRSLISQMVLFGAALCALALWKRVSLKTERRTRSVSVLLLLMTILSISSNAFFYYAPSQKGYVKHLTDRDEDLYLLTMESDVAKTKEAGEDEDFYRVSGQALKRENYGLVPGVSSTQFYWSLTNPNILQYFAEVGNSIDASHIFTSLGNSTILNALASVKYTLPGGEPEGLPFGSKKTDEDGKLYSTEETLPFGYTYSEVLPCSEFEALSTTERREALMEAAVLKDEIIDGTTLREFSCSSPAFDEQEIPFEVECGEGVSFDGKVFQVEKKGGKAFFSFSGRDDSETYFSVEQMNYTPFSTGNVLYDALHASGVGVIDMRVRFFKDEEEVSESELYTSSPIAKYKTGIRDAAISSGFFHDPPDKAELRFPQTGQYSFGDIRFAAQPMEQFVRESGKRRESVLEEVELHDDNLSYATNHITGKIRLDEPKVLLLSVPFENGWKAFVDGGEAQLLQANTMFMALALPAGEHDIILRYHTPGFFAGRLTGVAGTVIFIIILLIETGVFTKHDEKTRRDENE
ncbi:MAG: YfhO family protein [Lachnospiraceae bacterium]|nr:YfhO family protein [Lachnospiraceae bacterium]